MVLLGIATAAEVLLLLRLGARLDVLSRLLAGLPGDSPARHENEHAQGRQDEKDGPQGRVRERLVPGGGDEGEEGDGGGCERSGLRVEAADPLLGDVEALPVAIEGSVQGSQ